MTTLSIPQMSCGHCRATIERTIKAIDPLASLNFDLEARRVDVQTSAALPALQAALRTEGYDSAAA